MRQCVALAAALLRPAVAAAPSSADDGVVVTDNAAVTQAQAIARGYWGQR